MRALVWSLIAGYLLLVGVWPPAAAPVRTLLDGASILAAALIAAIPGAVWLALGALAYRSRT